jgi:predicted metalloendopeptidase
MWRLAGSVASILSENIRERRLQYLQTLTGVKKYQERWKECVGSTSGYLSIATSSLYIRKFFNQRSKDDALELVNMIRDEFKDILKTTEWMDDETRETALEKAEKIKNFIAYPDELKDDNKLIEYYEDLEIDSEEFFNSILKLGRFGTKKGMRKFREPVDKDDWKAHASVAVVNAFYNRIENSTRKFKNFIRWTIFNIQNFLTFLNYFHRISSWNFARSIFLC